MVQDIRKPPNKPIDELRPIKVVCIGAGYSGILTAIRFPQRIKNLDLKIYEKNADIGGTWFENRYPGIACDIPAHVYQFTFANNPNWSRFYAPGGEIQEYLKDVANKYDVEKYCHFQHFFEEGDWNEETQKWDLKFKNLATGETVTDDCDVLLKGTGILNNWKWPEIEGLHTFKGDLMHSAQWDPKFDVAGKTVALIGAGSSGIQILPQIQPKAKHIYHYMKGKTWISPFGYGAEGGDAQGPVEHSIEERQRWAENPSEYQAYRHKVEALMNASQLVTFRGTEIAAGFWEVSKQSHKDKLAKKPYINDLLTPTYPPGCRRLTPGPGYLEALVEDNVDYIGTGITKVTETGILDNNGDFHEVDAILCATGFDYSMRTDPPITGRNGITLGHMWDERPSAYMSMCVPNIPNMFIYLGPNGGPGAGSFIAMLECVAEYVIKCVKKLQLEYVGSMDVKPSAQKAFIEHVDHYFAGTIFTYNVSAFPSEVKPD